MGESSLSLAIAWGDGKMQGEGEDRDTEMAETVSTVHEGR